MAAAVPNLQHGVGALNGFKIPEAAANSVQPLSLTASDGTGLQIQSLDVKGRIFGAIAETTLHVGFQNPSHARREGRFRVSLPPRSSVTRLAMKINGTWHEADAAEISAARETYETIEHRQRDPLLVEQRREREIAARVFPIEAWETKEIIVSYSSEIDDSLPYTVPLLGLPQIGKLDISITERANQPPRFAIHTEDQKPTADIRIKSQLQGSRATRAGELVMVHLADGQLSTTTTHDPIKDGVGPVLFVVETSATQFGSLEKTANLLASVASAFPDAGSTRAAVLAYDQTTERVFDGALSGITPQAISSSFVSRGALGASDLENALVTAASEAKRINATRVIFVGGGIPTTGSSDPKRLRHLAQTLAGAGVERMDVLGTTALSDPHVYRPLLDVFAKHGTFVEDASLRPLANLSASLTQILPPTQGTIVIPGATWTRRTSPNTILATIPKTVSFVKARIGDELIDLPVDEAPAPLIEHSFAVAKVEDLIARGEREGMSGALKKDIIGLARKNKLATPFTALLVLESEADRNLLRSLEKNPEPKPKPGAPPPPSPSPPVASKAATPPMAGAHATKAPQLRAAAVQVNGRVPPEVIQRIVRMRFGAFRACYEEGLRRRGPQLGGEAASSPLHVRHKMERRVVIKFVIDHDGFVRRSEDAGSELGDAKVVQCVADNFKKMQFPSLDNQTVTVVYPIVFTPEQQDDDRPSVSHLPVWGRMTPRISSPVQATSEPVPPPLMPSPWTPEYGHVMSLLPYTSKDPRAVILAAADLRVRTPGPIAWVALGQAFEAAGDHERAARAYGSLADLYPERADMLRAAAVRIDAVNKGDRTAVSLMRRAVEDRPDQPSGHHLLALTLLRAGEHEAAFNAILAGARRDYPVRYNNVSGALNADLGIIAAAWAEARPDLKSRIEARASAFVTKLPDFPVVRAELIWETDTSDLDVNLHDLKGELATRQGVISNNWDGYGPDIVEVIEPNYQAGLRAHISLNRRGDGGGDVLGAVHIVKYDGRGHVTVEPRPFAIMNQYTGISLGEVH